MAIEPEATYAYSFQYRSDSPVHITIEYSQGLGGGLHYLDIVMLKPASNWQTFTAHLDNTRSITSFRPVVNGTKPGNVDTRSFDIHKIPSAELAKGIVSVAFDDGWQSVADEAVPLLEKYHIRSTQYVISEVAARNVVGYMDAGTLMNLKQSGNEIGSHSLTHCNQIDLSVSAIKDNARRSKQELESQKLGPIKTFAYPLGQYNETTQNIYAKEYPLIRSSDAGYNDRYFDETNIRSMGVLDKTSDKEFASWLEYARKHKQWVVLVYHRINESGEYNVTKDQLERQLRMVEASGLNVLPVSDAAEMVRK